VEKSIKRPQSVSAAMHPSVIRAQRREEPDIDWDYLPKLEPGAYRAYCRAAKIYFDRIYKRWVCAVQFDVLSADLTTKIGRLSWFLNLGSEEKPHATRRKKYWAAWTAANGGSPRRQDRVSPRVFVHRYAMVTVADTTKNFKQQVVTGALAYSVIRDVIRWETGDAESNETSLPAPLSSPADTQAGLERPQPQKEAETITASGLGPSRGQGSSTQPKPKGGRIASATRPSKATPKRERQLESPVPSNRGNRGRK
jgi:hypothetical protein